MPSQIGNASYAAVITFTTVGLGDFAPPFLTEHSTLTYKVSLTLAFQIHLPSVSRAQMIRISI